MRIRLIGIFYFMVVLFCGALVAQPVWATLPTPNQPILLVQDSTSANVYQNIVPEMLTTEGLNGFQVAQLSDLTSTFLANYDVVILPHLTLTTAEATLFQVYVNAGGTLVGFRPDVQLASVFGVASAGATLQEAWLKIDTTTSYASALVSNVMRFHGTADLYLLNGARSLATLYNSTTSPTTSPAATINAYGLGQAILFTYDLPETIVLMRQGNPAWAGYPNTHDGFNTMRATQMFMDQPSGQFWNDLGDGALNDIPQADIQMRLFSNLVTLTNAAKRPLPKFWYFPNQNRSQLLMTGDDHSYPVSDALSEINNIASYGGLFSYNLWYPFTTVSNSQVNTWLAAGYTMAIHFNDTAEVDSSGAGGSAASWNGMQSVISTALSSFKTTYPSAPFPVTTRNHFVMWVSNDADGTPDQVAQAKLFQNNGIQLDTSYSSFPMRWGYMTGSGLPMKFLDPAAGTVIPVYEQATQYEDDVQLNGGLNWSQSTAQSHYLQTLSDSLTKYNAVTTMLFHPENWSTYQSYADAAVQYAQAHSIPMSTTGKWLTFWQARAATTVSMPSFAAGTLTFTATGSPAGLTLLVPETSGGQMVSTFQVDGVSQSFTVASYQGVMYASVVLTAGTHNISVSYAPAGSILGQISPSAAAASTTIKAQSASITQSVPVAPDGTYVLGPLPEGSYTVTPSAASYTFSPLSLPVTLVNTNVTGVNFSAALTGETLFTTQTPAVTNDNDGVNHELGTSFTSDIPGQITAIRFWKASSESGTHTGHIWSSTGTLLASVTFANETASGWQKQSLTSPLSIAANTTYVVSVNTGNNYYVSTNGGLSLQVVNGDLSSIVGNNGLYGATGAFPTNTYQGSNYFRDIVFVPGSTYSISGTVSPIANGPGTTVTLSGAASATATADANGNYTFSGLLIGSYTVTPTKSGFTFSPTNLAEQVNGANITGANFTATAIPTHSISGTVSPIANGPGTTVTLSGAASATATADANGNYSFSGLLNGSYTVTPTKSGFTFNPTNLPEQVSGANITGANFTATAVPTYSISGTVSPIASGPGTTVTLSGAASATATADTNGNYTFSGLVNGSYTVTPTKSGFTFSPTNLVEQVNSANIVNVNFTATANPVTQTLFTTQTPAVANDSDGPGENHELGTSFTSDTTGLITAVRFWKASNETGTHTGRIWSSTGTLLASVTFANETASGWQQQSLGSPLAIAANTTYVVSVNTGNTYYVSTIGGLSTQVNSGDLHSVVGNNGLYGSTGVFPTNSYQGSNYFRDIVFAPGATYTVSGSITPAASGNGATVTLTGAANATVTADSSGNYTFTGVANGSYTVTPTKSGFTFSPTNLAEQVNGANITGANFTATAIPTYSISGTVSPIANGPGTTVTLSGAASATATADANGNYSFSGLLNGSYTVTPTKSGFTFNPTNLPEQVNGANITGANFTATAVPTYSISGTISPIASGPGTTVTLSGAASATATADTNGNYTFSGLVNGSYTVTPTKSGFTFSPTNLVEQVNSANIVNVNFTATANPVTQTLFTTQTPAVANDSDGPGENHELGTSFTSDTTGLITAVRFWKASNETGTHTGRIWSSTGTLLASVTFANETASGWQQQSLGSPLAIAANTTYVVSVNTGNTYYVSTTGGLSTQVNSGDLHSVVGNNGLYGSTGVFPTNSYQGSNYFRDIVFAPGATYTVSGSITPAASGNGATVTLTGAANATVTANSSGNYTFTGVANGSYTVTPTETGFAFSPPNAAVTVNGANFTVPTFTATAVPTYSVSGTIGPLSSAPGTTLTLSGAASATTTADSSGNYSFTGLAAGSYTITPTKVGYTFNPPNSPQTVTSQNITGLNFTATATSQSLFTTQTPATTNDSDGAGVNYELGMAFTSSTAGQITAIRFWKASSESGTHTGSIWSSTGTLLTSVTFSNETASGWQQQTLTTPLSITANTTYVVSVNTGNTYYVDSNSGLASQVVNGNLSSIVGNNGVYGSTGTFPTSSYQASNYFRDVVFVGP